MIWCSFFAGVGATLAILFGSVGALWLWLEMRNREDQDCP